MNRTELITSRILESIEIKHAVSKDTIILSQLDSLAQKCLESLKSGGKIVFAGNGGSFADAQHLSAEFTSRFLFNRKSLASIALGTNSSSMSAIGNDYGFDQVFAREIEGIIHPNDIFIAISTSGNSENILEAVKNTTEMGVYTVAWTGVTGGKLADICECIKIKSTNTARIQECHILIGHILCEIVESEYFDKNT